MSWLHYLIEANIYLGVFYLCYCLLLNRDTHYTLSRVYLIFSCVVAFLLPLTQVSILKPVEEFVTVQRAAIAIPITSVKYARAAIAPAAKTLSFDEFMVMAYVIGAIITCFILLFRLRKLYLLTRNKQSLFQDQYKLINLNEDNTAFSFFNYLFIGNNIPQAETIIAHEMVHIRQKHSVDIIFLEILKVINWFNPFIYLTQRSLKTVHEYIADEQTAAHEQDALTYSAFLLNNAYGIQGTSIAHSFFNYNLLKKRIIMLNKNRSGKLARLKYLAALPLCAGMLCTSTLVFSKNYGLIDLAPRKAIAQADTGRKLPPPPPPAPPKVKPKTPPPPPPAPPKVVKDQVKLPPPPPERPKKVKDQVKLPPPPIVIPDKPLKTSKDVKDKVVEVRIDKPMQVKLDKPMEEKMDKPMVLKKDRPMEVKIDKPMVLKLDKPAKEGDMPPPPAPNDPAYDNLLTAMAKTTRYPAVARDNKINGHNLLSFTINNDHKVTDVKVEKGIGYRCDEEAARALKAYSGIIKKAPGTYKMVVTFMLVNEDNKRYYSPQPLTDDILAAHNFIGEVVVSGYVK